jgi:hypothetical protein
MPLVSNLGGDINGASMVIVTSTIGEGVVQDLPHLVGGRLLPIIKMLLHISYSPDSRPRVNIFRLFTGLDIRVVAR